MIFQGEFVGIALGSNMGDRQSLLRQAVKAIIDQRVLTSVNTSSVYETVAVGEHAGGMFLNAVVTGWSPHSPRELLAGCMRIEKSLGRDRDQEGEGGPRTIDLDLLFVGKHLVNEPGLQLPHPRMFGRQFVLKPLSELAGDLILPTQKMSVHSLVESLDQTAIGRCIGPV
ncbi:MAG: 2-amino-4-hydroxy-6-hydroxymethyldihydropteridine diphosphokinase [Planctomycetes bacterium]|nr:2-amino-4-hydroxy-6-hydroxymethyldihydropteridine diphosphokinase [Planctomycetota bacterium]